MLAIGPCTSFGRRNTNQAMRAAITAMITTMTKTTVATMIMTTRTTETTIMIMSMTVVTDTSLWALDPIESPS